MPRWNTALLKIVLHGHSLAPGNKILKKWKTIFFRYVFEEGLKFEMTHFFKSGNVLFPSCS